MQNRALKFVCGLPVLTSSVELYSLHARNVLPIRGLHEYEVLKFVKQALNDEILHDTYFDFKCPPMALRDNLLLDRPRSITNLGCKRISSIGPFYFNKLPRELRAVERTSEFLSEVKNFLLREQTIMRLLSTRLEL